MQNVSATIYCPNSACQTANPESNRLCQHCGMTLPKIYLWAIAKGIETCQPGELLAGRYLVKQKQIVLDTQPGIVPNVPAHLPDAFTPYLRLSPYKPQVPQIYGVVSQAHRRIQSEVLLLEPAPVRLGDGSPVPGEIQLLPEVAIAWSTASGLRQLNWLWQMARLWQPLSLEKVASTLLAPSLLRANGSLVQLLELQVDRKSSPQLASLGQLWQTWLPGAQPEIAEFLAELCQQLAQGSIHSSEQLISSLDQALVACGQAYPRQITLATLSDRGPTRQRNEDACYPLSGTATLSELQPELPLVIVCDGIGGHEGGDVASTLAIVTLQQQLQSSLELSPPLPAPTLIAELEQATFAANDAISQQNDSEQRQDRQRMGTTLVMALVSMHELYLTHVGDSRAYRITATECQQVTVDDDLASREVRLGYATYREALQHPGSGSLVQALGMAASNLLHPTVQRFVLDEDCLFLLCSDGLSDNHRVEQHWQTELLPVLQGKVDLETAAKALVELANRKNGHDNVTVGLMYCRVGAATQMMPLGRSLALPIATSTQTTTPPTAQSTQLLAPQSRRSSLPLLVSALAVVGLAAVFTYLLLPQEVRFWQGSQPLSQPLTEPSPAVPPAALNPSSSLVNTQTLWQVISTPTADGKSTVVLSLPLVSTAKPETVHSVRVPPGSILKVIRQTGSNLGMVYTLKLCWVPSESPTRPGLGRPGEDVQATQTAIAATAKIALSNLSVDQRQSAEQYCAPLPANNPSSPNSVSLPP